MGGAIEGLALFHLTTLVATTASELSRITLCQRGDLSLTEKAEKQGMFTSKRSRSIKIALGFWVATIACALPSPARAAWVNSAATQF